MAARAERGLLVHAVRYALTAARLVTPAYLPLPTPCAGWDLRTLLYHLGDSMDALSEGLYTGFVQPGAAPRGDGRDDGRETGTVTGTATGTATAMGPSRARSAAWPSAPERSCARVPRPAPPRAASPSGTASSPPA